MNNTQIVQTVQAVETLYEDVMNLYLTYLGLLEDLLNSVPYSETDTLLQIQNHIQEIQAAMEHDMGIFDRAISEDGEGINKLKDNLKIQDIYNKLQK